MNLLEKIISGIIITGTLIFGGCDSRISSPVETPVDGLTKKLEEATDKQEDEILRKLKMIYVSEESGNFEIYSMNIDNRDKKQLTNTKAYELLPKWTPDGRIIFTSDRRNEISQIYIMDKNGENVKQLTNFSKDKVCAYMDKEGRIIYAEPITRSNTELYLLDKNMEIKRLTRTQENESLLDISPDGEWVLFNRDNINCKNKDANEFIDMSIYLLNIKSGLEKKICTGSEAYFSPKGRIGAVKGKIEQEAPRSCWDLIYEGIEITDVLRRTHNFILIENLIPKGYTYTPNETSITFIGWADEDLLVYALKLKLKYTIILNYKICAYSFKTKKVREFKEAPEFHNTADIK